MLSVLMADDVNVNLVLPVIHIKGVEPFLVVANVEGIQNASMDSVFVTDVLKEIHIKDVQEYLAVENVDLTLIA